MTSDANTLQRNTLREKLTRREFFVAPGLHDMMAAVDIYQASA